MYVRRGSFTFNRLLFSLMLTSHLPKKGIKLYVRQLVNIGYRFVERKKKKSICLICFQLHYGVRSSVSRVTKKNNNNNNTVKPREREARSAKSPTPRPKGGEGSVKKKKKRNQEGSKSRFQYSHRVLRHHRSACDVEGVARSGSDEHLFCTAARRRRRGG